ncbi:substrate-binding periplasmic protein [Spirochaeta dissipatitropha]
MRTQYQDLPPKYFMQDGEIAGVCVELITALNEEFRGIQIVLAEGDVFTPWTRIQNNLQQGTIDVFLGMAKTDDRLKDYIWIDVPVYTVRRVFARQRNSGFIYSGKYSLHGQRIATTRSSASAATLLDMVENPDSIYLVDQLSQALQMLAAGRVDLVFFHTLGMDHEISALGLSEYLDIAPGHVDTYNHYIVMQPDTLPWVVSEVTRAMQAIRESSVHSAILQDYGLDY